MSDDVTAAEYLYGIKAEHYDGNDDHVPTRVVSFRITKKTPKRIYYVRRERGSRTEIGYVDRQKIEADGEIYNKAAGGWWAPDLHLYLNPPEIQKAGPGLAELKAAMRAAHPDMGGSHEGFLEAHQRYEKARAAAQRAENQR